MTDIIEIKPGERILISRTDRLGDLILALPLVETIARRYPDNPVDVLASLYASPILENNPAIDKIFRVQNDQLKSSKLYRKDFLHRLKMNNYRVVVAMFPERQVCQLFNKANIPDRIGTVGRFHSVFFNHHLFHSRKANQKHECEYNLDFLQFFRDGETVRLPKVYPLEKDLNNARRILSEAGVDGEFVAIHPCSGGSADSWPLESFAQLAEKLEKTGHRVVFTGSADERPRIEEHLTGRRADLVNLSSTTDLRTLAALLSLAATLVANSTGPLHLASAVGTTVLGLYPGKQVMSPVRWGPLGEGHLVIQPKGSDNDDQPASFPGMETIGVGEVFESITRLIKRTAKRI